MTTETEPTPLTNLFVEMGFPPMPEFFDPNPVVSTEAMLRVALAEVQKLRSVPDLSALVTTVTTERDILRERERDICKAVGGVSDGGAYRNDIIEHLLMLTDKARKVDELTEALNHLTEITKEAAQNRTEDEWTKAFKDRDDALTKRFEAESTIRTACALTGFAPTLTPESDDEKLTAEALIQGIRTLKAERVKAPEDLYPETKKLVHDFATALGKKLFAAQLKYGYTAEWTKKDWLDECRLKLVDRVAHGDPLDVAAYAAFLWYHNSNTTLPLKDTVVRLTAERDVAKRELVKVSRLLSNLEKLKLKTVKPKAKPKVIKAKAKAKAKPKKRGG